MQPKRILTGLFILGLTLLGLNAWAGRMVTHSFGKSIKPLEHGQPLCGNRMGGGGGPGSKVYLK